MLKYLIPNIGALTKVNVLHSVRSYARRVKDPGIDKRLKLFSDDFIQEEDSDIFESVESDFMNVHEAHKDFEEEEKAHKQKVHTMMVGRKYFNEKGINFLTWSEKEQIRLLNEQNPREWNPDKLSKSFPADPLSISKIIRNKWQPRDEKRIQKHDESVIKSWQKFKAGELEVDPILADHLKKFAHRDFNEVTKAKVNRKLGFEIPKPKTSEFLSIITSCKKYSEDRDSTEAEQGQILQLESSDLTFPKHRPTDPEKDSFLLRSKSTITMKSLTLKEYEKYSPDITEKRELNNKVESVTPLDTVAHLTTIKHQTSNVSTLSANDSKVFRSLDIKEFISIPRKAWKKDKIYKVGDCFYADDGEFLYRVPGLT